MSVIGRQIVFLPRLFVLTAYTSAQSGVTYTDGLGGLTPTALQAIGKAISQNAAITNTTEECWLDGSGLHRHIALGDTISAGIDGETHDCLIVGFNHFALSSATAATAYGEATATGMAGLAFETDKLITTGKRGDQMAAYLEDTVFPAMSIRAVVKQVRTAQSSGLLHLFAPSPKELSTSGWTSSFGAYLRWYRTNTSAKRTKQRIGSATASAWWTRLTYSETRYYGVTASGDITDAATSTSRPTAPIFCI